MINGGEESFRKEAFFFLNEKRNTRPVRFICSMQVFAELQDIVYGVQAVKNKGWMPVGIPKKA